MRNYDPSSKTQALHSVYENGHAVTGNGAGTIPIVCVPDASSGKNILFWDDIKAVFHNALYVRSGDNTLPFLKGPDFKNLNPLRIAAIPGVTLNVVVSGPATITSPPLSALQAASHEYLTHKNIEGWKIKATNVENATFFGSYYFPTNRSEVSSTTSRLPLIVSTESEAQSLWNRSPKDTRREGRPSIVAPNAQATQHQQRIRNDSLDSPQKILSALTSFTPEHAIMVAVNSRDHFVQEALGDMYMDGRHVPKDVQAAIDCYLKASNQRSSTAIERKLSSICYSNPGLTRECLTAIDRHRKAADQGDPTSQCNVGDLYFVAKKYDEAMAWFQKAAQQGYAYAQSSIGSLYHAGNGTSQDFAEAMTWYQKAAGQGRAGAQANIGALYFHGQGVSRDYAEAMIWYRKAAEQGDANAQTSIGYLYHQGFGLPQDYAEAMIWYRKAAELGDANAQNFIGHFYHNGFGLPQDYAEAMTWYQKAAEQGDDANAQNTIGRLYQQGLGVPQDYAKAMTWYQKAAEQGDADAQTSIGYLYHQGLGLSQDYVEAKIWFQKAARQGHATAQYYLGRMFEDGRGVNKDMSRALEWYKKAAEEGSSEAEMAFDKLEKKRLLDSILG